jgi:hypothetical protein
MVNEVVLNYLKEHSRDYPLESLKSKILSSGYSENEFNEAYAALHAPHIEKKEHLEEKKEIHEEKEAQHEEKKLKVQERHEEGVESIPKTSSAEGKLLGKRWIKLAAIFGIVAFLFSIFSSFSSSSETISFIFYLITAISSMIFVYGFIVIGKRYNGRLIKISGWLAIIVVVLFLLINIGSLIFPDLLSGIIEAPSSVEDLKDFATFAAGMIVLLLSVLFVFIVLGILFGIGLLKLKENVKHAKTTGMLLIIGSSTMIIGLGLFVLAVAFVFGIILLFKESAKSLNTN